MNLAHAATEADDGLNPLDVEDDKQPLTHEELIQDLNIGFVREFNLTPLTWDVLREFVFALDHLEELVDTHNFPNARLLNTPDIATTGQVAVNVFNDLARRGQDQGLWGCAVGAETADVIERFLRCDYLKTLALVFKYLRRDSIMLTLDGLNLQIALKQHTAHPEFGMLVYNNFNNDTEVMLPFHLTRISGV